MGFWVLFGAIMAIIALVSATVMLINDYRCAVCPDIVLIGLKNTYNLMGS